MNCPLHCLGKTTALGQPRPTSAAHNDPAYGPTADASEPGQELGTPHQAGRVGERVGVRPLNKELGISSSRPREAVGGHSSLPPSSGIRPSLQSSSGPSGAHPSGSSLSSSESSVGGGDPDISSRSRCGSGPGNATLAGKERQGPSVRTGRALLARFAIAACWLYYFYFAMYVLGMESVFWTYLSRIFPKLGQQDEDW